jgi:predicted ATPase/class 3 adenylate cyclase
MSQPTGTVTLLFTDIEGSTSRWERHADRFGAALQDHDRIIREIAAKYQGYEFKTVGDAFMIAFQEAANAVLCAGEIQIRFAFEAENNPLWKEVEGLKIRIGIHTGEPTARERDYLGPPVNRTSRICDAGHGGMTLLSRETVLQCIELEEWEFEDCGLHRLKDLGQAERIFRLKHDKIPEPATTQLRTLEALPHNFPAQVTSFVGRTQEITELKGLLRSGKSRLITMTGPGGTGKTRLSMQLAADQMHHFPGGIWFVELAGTSDHNAVPFHLANALSIDLLPNTSPLKQVIEFLRRRTALLVLDNFEQVTDAADIVAEILRECPTITCLITSRELLRITGELEYPLEPLSTPPTGSAGTDWLQYDSVQLFIERCQSMRQDFTVTDDIGPTIVELCRRLEGIPLALELAAARVRGMSVKQILQKLSHRFDLLASGHRDLPERQRTLRHAIDWSYDLLSQDEQALFAELSVFTGGFYPEAAEVVCTTYGAFDLVFSLRDKSLLKVEEIDGSMRYRMLESLREYADEKLQANGKAEELRGRHADYYLELAQEWGERLDGSGSNASDAMKVFHEEIENMRKGMDWSVECSNDERTTAYGKSLARYFLAHGPYDECDTRLSIAEDACRHLNQPSDLSLLLLQHGRLAWRRAAYQESLELCQESLQISESVGDHSRMIAALVTMGKIAWGQADYSTACTYWERGLELSREIRNVRYEAVLLSNLAAVASDRGNLEDASKYFADGLAIQRRINHEVGVAYTLMNSADVLRRQQRYDAACERLQESRELFTKLGYRTEVALVCAQMGRTLFESGNTEQAEELIAEGLATAHDLKDSRCEMYALDVMARIEGRKGNYDRSAELFQKSYDIAVEVGDGKHVTDVLLHAGEMLETQGANEAAYWLLSVAMRDYKEHGLADAAHAASALDRIGNTLDRSVVNGITQQTQSASTSDAIGYLTFQK